MTLHRWRALVVALAVSASAIAAPAPPFQPMFDQARQHYALPGLAMAVVEDGQVVYQHTAGERRIGTGEAIDENTLFKIASNSKAMTAALLARLVDRGALRWDDPVIRYLPQFRMHDPWVTEHMQVRDLLIHNSGLGLGAGDLMLWPEPNAFTRQDIIAGLAHLKPVTSFRSGYAYDNLMYVVAGEVAARAGGKPYDQLLREEVFVPLGMQRCQVGAWSVAAVGNVAQPHARRDGRNVVTQPDADTSPDLASMAAGGIRCSLRDMTRWMQVLLDPAQVPGWLSDAQRRALWTAHMPMPIGARQRQWDNAHFAAYGYGWRLSDLDGQWKVGHTGTLSGMYSSRLLHDEQQQRRDSGHVRPDTRARTPASLQATAAWQGRYRDPWLGPARVCPHNGRLRFQLEKSPQLQGTVMQLGARWLVQWDTLGADAEPWLQPQPGTPPTLALRAIDPDIDFSYDYQDLQFTRIGDCP